MYTHYTAQLNRSIDYLLLKRLRSQTTIICTESKHMRSFAWQPIQIIINIALPNVAKHWIIYLESCLSSQLNVAVNCPLVYSLVYFVGLKTIKIVEMNLL